MKLCGRRRSSGASSKLRVSRRRTKHESALKIASAAKARNVRLRGRGCATEFVALGNLERQDSGRESIPVARSRCAVVPRRFLICYHLKKFVYSFRQQSNPLCLCTESVLPCWGSAAIAGTHERTGFGGTSCLVLGSRADLREDRFASGSTEVENTCG